MSTASLAAAGVSDQRYRSAGLRPARAAAWRRQRTAVMVCCRQKLPDSVPCPASVHKAQARIMAVCGASLCAVGNELRWRTTAPARQIPYEAEYYACHKANGAVDTTFTQFYPIAKPIAVKAGTFRETP